MSKNQVHQHIKQVLDRNRTKIGRPKVTDIEYNTAVPFISIRSPIDTENGLN